MVDERDEPRRIVAIDAAFRAGDLEALRAAAGVEAVPNGPMPLAIGSCLEYAIYHSPLPFIKTLLEIGADPNPTDSAGFPPLIAALTAGRAEPGAPARRDVDGIIRLLLAFHADPNQRGINDYTPLHMAVAERNLLAIQRLLDAGADPALRTRIDEMATPAEMARAAGFDAAAALIERGGQPAPTRLRSGLELLFDAPGSGSVIRRGARYRVRLRMWLNKGDPVTWRQTWGTLSRSALEDGGQAMVTEVRVDRVSLINGLFYGVDGMRVGGTRRLQIAPHLAYGDQGIPDVIPAAALLTAEITILEEVG